MNQYGYLYCSLIGAAVLAGCASGGGGGGSGSGGAAAAAAAVSVLGIAPNSTASASGVIVNEFFVSEPGLTTSGSFSSDSQAATAQGSTGADGRLTSVTVNVPAFVTDPPSVVSVPAFSDTYALTAPSGTSLIYEGSGTSVAASTVRILDPVQQTWNYQTVVLVTRPLSGAGGLTGNATHALSLGSVTPVASVPATGTGTYNGRAIGQFTATGGTATNMVANVQATADFAARSVNWALSNAVTGNNVLRDPSSGTANAALNLSGGGTWSAGGQVWFGAISNAASSLSGSVVGRLYGTNAEEIGGSFVATGTAGQVIGGFGGKR